jgi:hypothetical protein
MPASYYNLSKLIELIKLNLKNLQISLGRTKWQLTHPKQYIIKKLNFDNQQVIFNSN